MTTIQMMMKIRLTKDHVLGKAADVVEVDAGRANYLLRCGSAVEHADVDAEKTPVKKKAPKTKKAPAKKKAAPKKTSDQSSAK